MHIISFFSTYFTLFFHLFILFVFYIIFLFINIIGSFELEIKMSDETRIFFFFETILKICRNVRLHYLHVRSTGFRSTAFGQQA